ncbi:MAG: DinB family protein [Candidatus Rokuibacteriota bacterium]
MSFTPAEAALLLVASGEAIRAEAQALPQRLATFHPAPGEWCVNEVLGHLIEAERRGFAGRLRIILSAGEPRLESWDQNEVARQRGDCERDTADLLRELAALRHDAVTLVAALRPADLARGGLHPKVGRLRVDELLHEWVHHDRNHLKQILTNVQLAAWPAMGNAQKFSGP